MRSKSVTVDPQRIIHLALALLITFGMSAIVMATLRHRTEANGYIALLAAILVFAVLSFVLAKLFVFSDLGERALQNLFKPRSGRTWLVRVGFVAALVPSLAYIAARTVLLDYNANDFRYFWLAGDLWGQGMNPYDTQIFLAHGAKVFNAGDNNPGAWPYPPWIWILARSAAILPFPEAQMAWRLSLAALLLGSVLILGGRITRSAAREGASHATWYCIAMLLFACTMRSSAESLALGQTSHLVLLGLMLALVALIEDRRGMGVAAMVVLAMKPQIGLIIGFFMLGTIRWFWTLVIAGIVVVLLTIPPVLIAGIVPTIGGFLGGLSQYNTTPLNLPVGMTGLRHLVFEANGAELNAMVMALIGGGIALLLGFLLYRRAESALARRRILGLVLLILVNFAPLHTYETVYIAPLIVLMIGWPALVQIAVGLGLVIICRSEMVAAATGWFDPRTPFFLGTTIDSVCFLALLFVWSMAMVRDGIAGRASAPNASALG